MPVFTHLDDDRARMVDVSSKGEVYRKAIATGTIEREMVKYDIIAGKIADDATNATLTAYLAGAFGTEGDQEAAIECLKFVKGEKIWLK